MGKKTETIERMYKRNTGNRTVTRLELEHQYRMLFSWALENRPTWDELKERKELIDAQTGLSPLLDRDKIFLDGYYNAVRDILFHEFTDIDDELDGYVWKGSSVMYLRRFHL